MKTHTSAAPDRTLSIYCADFSSYEEFKGISFYEAFNEMLDGNILHNTNLDDIVSIVLGDGSVSVEVTRYSVIADFMGSYAGAYRENLKFLNALP